MSPAAWKANLVALFIAQTCAMIAFSFVFPFIPLYVRDLGVTNTAEAARWAGAIGAATAITMAIAQPFWGSLADRYGRRVMALRSLTAASITLVLGYRVSCFASSLLMLVAVLCVVVFVRETFTPPPATAARQSILANSRQLLAVPGLVLVMGIAFLIQYGNTVIAPILALFIHELANGINAASTAGGIMAGTGVAGALSAVVVGRLGDRLGHRRVLPVCLLGAALVCLPQALVRSPRELFAMRLALGLFLGGLMPSANALLAGLVPAERRGSAFGLSATAVAMANMIGPLSGALLAGALGMRSVFVATAALYGVGLVFVLLRFRHLPSRADTARPSIVPAHPLE